ncbi:hypothetical protein PInf_018992 [Phytophthora infestans]|nr:hypothetical protein PInf_018992 [Phytophthora infestans]
MVLTTPWDLYDLSEANNPDSLDAMKNLFFRSRGLWRKGIDGVEYGALLELLYAFIKRWNLMTQAGESLVAWLEHREGIVAGHSLSELRSVV